jgi:hypothetical protein
MKTKIGKLAAFVVIVAWVIFMTSASAPAGDHQRKTLHGEYGWTGPVHCISAPINAPASISIFSSIAQGTCTFRHDGTGEVRFTSVSITDSPVASPGASLYEASYQHTYKITDDGAITIDAVPNTYVQKFLSGPYMGFHLNIDVWPLTGWVSADYKTMTIATPEPKFLTMTFSEFPVTLSGICHASFTLIRLSD